MRSELRHQDLRSSSNAISLPAALVAQGWLPKDAASPARTLLREQLTDGPRPGSRIEAVAQTAETTFVDQGGICARPPHAARIAAAASIH